MTGNPDRDPAHVQPPTNLRELHRRTERKERAIVKRIVQRLGGEVSVQSSGVPGEGACFSFTLPAA